MARGTQQPAVSDRPARPRKTLPADADFRLNAGGKMVWFLK
jgi:hypothetical protein